MRFEMKPPLYRKNDIAKKGKWPMGFLMLIVEYAYQLIDYVV